MKKVFFCLMTLSLANAHAQNVGIGTPAPDASAKLDVSSTDKGILVPRMTSAQRTAITSPAKGLLVYQTDLDSGFYYNGGIPTAPNWINMLGQLNGWSTKGNSGTNPTINFLGTIDNKPLNFRADNRKAGTIDDSLHNVFYGVNAGFNTAPTTPFDARSNTFIGDSAGFFNTTGSVNVFVGRYAGLHNTTALANSFFGYQAGLNNTTGQPNSFFGYNSGANNTTGGVNAFFGYNSGGANTTGEENNFFGASAGGLNTTGNQNAFFGRMAGFSNTSGSNNVSFGSHAGYQNTVSSNNTMVGDSAGYNSTGANNSFLGRSSGLSNTTGSQNTFIGNSADVAVGNLSNATAIGSKSFVASSNSMVLGSINGVNGATADTKVGIGTTTPTNKLHIVLNDQGGAPAGLLVENIGSPGVGEATIALKNIATGDSTWMIGLNETNHLSFALGTQLVGGTTKMFLNANGNLGVGTVTPGEKLEVNGNIKLNGNVVRPTTGTANLVPIYYGSISSSGSIDSGTGNFSVSHTSGSGVYTIHNNDETYSFISYTTIVTPVGLSAVLASTFSSAGDLQVRLFNASGTAIDSDFNFVVFHH